jgi:16S rRNA (cytosine1402-N4)-methyltransferase
VSSTFHHLPVLLKESLEHLNLRAGAVVVDGTLGGGGHASEILERTGPDGVLIGLDLDEEALDAATERLSGFGERFRAVHASFRVLDDAVRSVGHERVDAVLLDLGVSSHQLDVSRRGFRFAGDENQATPLDMRMDPHSEGPSAADLLARASADELQGWFQRYGELPGARRLARTITEERRHHPLRTTADLLRVIHVARVGRGRKHNPATLVFQALRIAVNDELGALEEGLDAAVEVLRPGGHLVVIAYHSLEDRIVKQRLRAEARGCICPPEVPICVCGHKPRVRVVTRKPLRPTDDEIDENPRARSARLRSAERIEEAA